MKKTFSKLELLSRTLGHPQKRIGAEHIWACPYCRQTGGDKDGDHFKYNEQKDKYACFADNEHTKAVSKAIRDSYLHTKKFKKTESDLINIEDAPQEILDYFGDRLMTVEGLQHFGLKWDQLNNAIAIPTALMKYKFKSLLGDSWWQPGINLNQNTIYSVDKKYQGQKKFLYLEGIPDIWSIYSIFPKEFFDQWYVCATVHGCTHVPKDWQDPLYWKKFDRIVICGDADIPGQKAVEKLNKLIGPKAQVLELPFKHKRLVNGEEVEFNSKDFNDWIIEGNTYEDFEKLLISNVGYDEYVEKAAWDFLKSPNLIEIYLQECELFNLFGEYNNKVQVFIENNSRLSKDIDGGISSKAQAPTAVGKTTLYKIIGKNFFQDDFIMIGDMAEKAMMHLEDGAWKQKIILFEEDYVTKETPASETKNYQLRIAKSEGIFTYKYTDTSKKPFSIIEKELKGPFVFQSATTKLEFKDEDINRDTVHHFDESSAQTAYVIELQKDEAEVLDPDLLFARKFIVDKHKKVQQILKEYIPDKIIVPDIVSVLFPHGNHRARRDFVKVIKYVKTVTFLHQFQRRVLSGKEYFEFFKEKIEKNRQRRVQRSKEAGVKFFEKMKKVASEIQTEIDFDENPLKSPFDGNKPESQLPSPIQDDGNNGISRNIGVDSVVNPVEDWFRASTESQKGGGEGVYKKFINSYLEQNQRILVSVKEDIDIVLKYIAPDLAKEYSSIDASFSNKYDILKRYLKINNEFKAKDAAKLLGTSKQYAQKILKCLEEQGLCTVFLERRPYVYKLVPGDLSIDNFNIIGWDPDKPLDQVIDITSIQENTEKKGAPLYKIQNDIKTETSINVPSPVSVVIDLIEAGEEEVKKGIPLIDELKGCYDKEKSKSKEVKDVPENLKFLFTKRKVEDDEE